MPEFTAKLGAGKSWEKFEEENITAPPAKFT
jgi:hypothetical protein